jgi:excisionase family DNA binding protein
MERLLTPADAARILGVVPATIRAMALSGRLLPAVTTERGMRLFRREDVERLAAARDAKGTQLTTSMAPPDTGDGCNG